MAASSVGFKVPSSARGSKSTRLTDEMHNGLSRDSCDTKMCSIA